MELREGMEVRMSSVGKSKYRDDSFNPYELIGKITAVHDRINRLLPIRVLWSNNHTNIYNELHLEPAFNLRDLKIEDFL